MSHRRRACPNGAPPALLRRARRNADQLGLFGQPRAKARGLVARKDVASWVEDLEAPEGAPRLYPIPGAILSHATSLDDPARSVEGKASFLRHRFVVNTLGAELLDHNGAYGLYTPPEVVEFLVVEHGSHDSPEALEAWRRWVLPHLSPKGYLPGIAEGRKQFKRWQKSAAAKRAKRKWGDRRYALLPNVVAGPERRGAWSPESAIAPDALALTDTRLHMVPFEDLRDDLWIKHWDIGKNIGEFEDWQRLALAGDRRVRRGPLHKGADLRMAEELAPPAFPDGTPAPALISAQRTDEMRPSARWKRYQEQKRQAKKTAPAAARSPAEYDAARRELLESR